MKIKQIVRNGQTLDVKLAATGVIKLDGTWIGRVKEIGVGRFSAALETPEVRVPLLQLGNFRTRQAAVEAVVDAAIADRAAVAR